MRGLFLRIENWLLVIPVLLLVIEQAFLKKSAFDFHIHDTYFVVGGFFIGVVILLLCWILYLCHFSLRARKSGNKKILGTHVIATVVLLLIFSLYNFIMPYWGNPPMKPRQYYDFSSWQSLQHFSQTGSWFAMTFYGFVLIQVSFILYTILRLIVKK